jgi:hypothetical protein
MISLFYEGIWIAIVNTVTASVGIWTIFCWIPNKLIQTARRKLTTDKSLSDMA